MFWTPFTPPLKVTLMEPVYVLAVSPLGFTVSVMTPGRKEVLAVAESQDPTTPVME
jgi:hypothetical protein